jgi:hypothetical protein
VGRSRMRQPVRYISLFDHVYQDVSPVLISPQSMASASACIHHGLAEVALKPLLTLLAVRRLTRRRETPGVHEAVAVVA